MAAKAKASTNGNLTTKESPRPKSEPPRDDAPGRLTDEEIRAMHVTPEEDARAVALIRSKVLNYLEADAVVDDLVVYPRGEGEALIYAYVKQPKRHPLIRNETSVLITVELDPDA